MQASKIRPEQVYAIRYRPPGENEVAKMPLVRFNVTAIVTRRGRNTGSPHDFSSTVEGYIDREDAARFNIPAEHAGSHGGDKPKIVVQPDDILGPFQEHAELVARREAEQRAKEATDQQFEDNRLEALRLLYVLTGLPFPNDPKSYNNPFKVSGRDIDITPAGIDALLVTLRDRLKM